MSGYELARSVRERFRRPAAPLEALCYRHPRAFVPVSVVIVNDQVIVLDAEVQDHEAIRAMGAEVVR